MNIILIFIGGIIILTGFAIKQFKLYELIAGYNTMSTQEKALFNIEKFTSIMMITFLIIGLVIIMGTIIGICLKIEFLGLIILFLDIFIGLTFLNVKGRQLKKIK